MKKAHLLIATAWAAHLVAWFVPVVRFGVTLPDGLPGWEAFRVAASAIWPSPGVQINNWYGAVLSGASAITTVLFILASPWIVFLTSTSLSFRGAKRRGIPTPTNSRPESHSLCRASAWIAAASFIVNSHWCLIGFSDLRIGYFLWWASFGLLSSGLFVLARADKSGDKKMEERSTKAARVPGS